MSILINYKEEIHEKLSLQLGIYTTMGTPIIESPMWFIFTELDNKENVLRFNSSQNNYMFFSIPLHDEDKGKYFEYKPMQDEFRAMKYEYIKANWPAVYYELRPNEKPIEVKKEVIPAPVIFETETETDYEKQAEDFLKATNTTFQSIYKTHDYYFPDDKDTRDIYTIVLKNSRHRYRFTFGQSIANTGKHPSAYDVLACLQKYDVGSFENFCGEFGYDNDSRKAYKTYKAVLKEWKNIFLLFTSKELELLQEIN